MTSDGGGSHRFEPDEVFDSEVDERYEDVEIEGVHFRPSTILWELDNEVYGQALDEFRGGQVEQLKQAVVDRFPAPVAHYFYRFQHGAENQLQRLHLLRDTWEALIILLLALVLGECRLRGISLEPSPANFKQCLSDSLSDRLLLIERILEFAEAEGVELGIAKIVPIETIGKIRELNATRNAFSHSAAVSETQAENYVAECYDDVIEVLAALRGLEDVSLIRYLDQQGVHEIRYERFDGHATTKTIKELTLTDVQLSDSSKYLAKGQVLASIGDLLLSVSPFFHTEDDKSGHVTRLCLYKRATAPKDKPKLLEFEVVGEARRTEIHRSIFWSQLNEIRELFGLVAERTENE